MVDPEAVASEDAPSEDEELLEDETTGKDRYVGIGVFRFRFDLANFQPGRGFSKRQFSIAEAVLLLMAAYIASRGLGVIRQSIFNSIFGTSLAANAYYAAFRLPDTLFNLIAGGALTHALIPIFVSYDKERGRVEAWRLTSVVFNVLFVALAAVLLAAEFLAPTFVNHILVPGFDAPEQALTTSLTRIMLVQPLILGLGTVLTAVLSSKRQFLLPAFAIAVYNIGLIGGLLFTLAFPVVGIYGPTCGVLVGALFHVAVQIPGLLKQNARYFFAWNLKDPGLRQVLRLLGPNVASVAVASTAVIVDTYFVSYLANKSSLAAQHNAYMIFAFPVALLSQAVAQSALPQLAALATKDHYARLRRLLFRIAGAALLLGVLVTILLCFAGKPVIHILFQHGAFKRNSTNLTNLALIAYAVGLPGAIAVGLFTSTFYAFKDAMTPLLTNIFNVAAHIGLIFFLLTIFTGQNAIQAIPLAASGSASAEAVLLGLLLYLRFRSKIANEQHFPVVKR
ncbi:MAG TPA: murein biosynthesis integral membrane protein MurJ [Ktedonobacteraceae bacterium]|nr:murein biosynthesis integral membrane protein MurJ [Ktedonobacteraceae bacterium]